VVYWLRKDSDRVVDFPQLQGVAGAQRQNLGVLAPITMPSYKLPDGIPLFVAVMRQAI
jgi:hypothetical protein